MDAVSNRELQLFDEESIGGGMVNSPGISSSWTRNPREEW
jgi:hypothetical protein